jgi:hypothetical protein
VSPPPRDGLFHWAYRLFGISVERQAEAQDHIASWEIPAVASALSPTSIDRSIGAVLLVESIHALRGQGVEESKIMAKLRRDPDVWPTWAELRAAGLLARETAGEASFRLEPDRRSGRHADFVFASEGEPSHSIEFKAIGLSDAEAAFSNRMAPLLPGLLPRFGFLTMHVEDTNVTVALNREERRHHRRDAERKAKHLYPAVRQVAAVTIVGHGTESSYLSRLRSRFEEAFQQLPGEDPSWVAFHWSNGAPIELVDRALENVDIPDNLAGIVLIGSVGIPGNLSNFIVWRLAPFGEEGESEWHSDTDVDVAQTIFWAVDKSAGVRPCYVTAPWQGRKIDVVHRTGSSRIFPFNIVLSPDPHDLVPGRVSNR